LKLTLQAIVAACDDAGVDPRDIDGFASYADDANAGQLLMAGLGTREMRWSSMVWGGGGGGSVGAVAMAAAAILSGQAEIVAVHRTIAEASSGRLQNALIRYGLGPHYVEHGVVAPAQNCALRTQRLLHLGVPESALEAVARAAYFHASRNPRARAYGKPLSAEGYQAARWITEPFGLFDCSQESDVSVAMILTSAERARDLKKTPISLLAVAQSGLVGRRYENDPDYASGGFKRGAARLWAQSGLSPADIDVAQIYDNFTGPVVQALIDHGLCTVETAGDVLTYDNLTAPGGKLPLNTSGGLLAEGNAHGMGLIVEAVRQLRGESPNPVPDALVSLVTGGATTGLPSCALFGRTI
jgi:acetyl-CoA acetyltransferase